MRKFYVSCVDLTHLNETCCTSCHDEADEGYSDLFELEESKVIARVCCSIANLNPTRNDLAKALREKRKCES